MFDAQNFLSTTYEEALDDVRIPIPVGEYVAQIVKIDTRDGIIGKGERTGQPWAALKLQCDIKDEALEAMLQRSPVTAFGDIFLELTPSGGLDMSKQKNVELGALRSAAGQNLPGQPWAIPMLMGAWVRVKVSHRMIEGRSTPMAEITGYAKQ